MRVESRWRARRRRRRRFDVTARPCANACGRLTAAGICADCRLAASQARQREKLEASRRAAPAPPGDAAPSVTGGTICLDCGTRYDATAARSLCPKCGAKAPLALDPPARKVDVDVVEARDKAIFAALNRNGGLAMIRTLRLAIPATDPAAKTPALRDEAIKNALFRLKAKGKVERTGDTWSIVGIGTAIGAGA